MSASSPLGIQPTKLSGGSYNYINSDGSFVQVGGTSNPTSILNVALLWANTRTKS